jgi:hypothetical protein
MFPNPLLPSKQPKKIEDQVCLVPIEFQLSSKNPAHSRSSLASLSKANGGSPGISYIHSFTLRICYPTGRNLSLINNDYDSNEDSNSITMPVMCHAVLLYYINNSKQSYKSSER